MKTLSQEVSEVRWEATLVQLRHVRVQNGLRHLDARGLLVEGIYPRGALVEYDPETPDVAHEAVGAILDALGGHVSARAG